MYESSGGSSPSLRTSSPSSTARVAPTEMLIFYPVCRRPQQNTITVGLAASPSSRTAESSSSEPAGFALTLRQTLVSVRVGWFPALKAPSWVGCLAPTPIFANIANMGRVRRLTTYLIL